MTAAELSSIQPVFDEQSIKLKHIYEGITAVDSQLARACINEGISTAARTGVFARMTEQVGKTY